MESCLEEENKGLVEFLNSIKKVKESRSHKVTQSIGVYDAYKWIRKNKWLNIGRPLTEHEFYNIIRRMNNYLAESLILGNDITLPNRMGRLELRKYDVRFSFKDGKVRSNLPIDWDKTLKLWHEDEEAYRDKTLVKIEEKEICDILDGFDFRSNDIHYAVFVGKNILQIGDCCAERIQFFLEFFLQCILLKILLLP